MDDKDFIINPRSKIMPSHVGGPGRIKLRNGKFVKYENSPVCSEKRWMISEMINPDGSVTIRRIVLKPDGSRGIVHEEYSSLDMAILGRYDELSVKEEPLSSGAPDLEQITVGSDSTRKDCSTSITDHSIQNRDFYAHWNKQSRDEYPPLTRKPPFKQPEEAMKESDIYDAGPATTASGSKCRNSKETRFGSSFSRGYISLGVGSSCNDNGSLVHKIPVASNMNHAQRPGPSNREQMGGFIPVTALGGEDPDVSALSMDEDVSNWSLLRNEESVKDSGIVNNVVESKTKTAAMGQRLRICPPDTVTNCEELAKAASPLGRSPHLEHELLKVPITKLNSAQKLRVPRKRQMHDQTPKTKTQTVSATLNPKTKQTPKPVPKPKIKYYSDPIISDSDSVEPWEFDQFRNQGALFDARSALSNESSETLVNQTFTYTVRKLAPEDKVGVFVGVKELSCGPRLVVSKVSKSGLLSESPIEKDDVIRSINGVSFHRNPMAREALDIVRSAPDLVTFVVEKTSELYDTENDNFSLPSLPYKNVDEICKTDETRIVTKRLENEDGSETMVMEYFNSRGRKTRQTHHRRRLAFDGSIRDISMSSLSSDGEIFVHVTKTSRNKNVGLRLETSKGHRGRETLVVAQVFPSGLFARSPLSVGDVILSINGNEFDGRIETAVASTLLSNALGDVKILGLKSQEWITNQRNRVFQTRDLMETFTIPGPKSKPYDFDDCSYGSLLVGYSSAKKLSIGELSEIERLNLRVERLTSQWGTLLFVTNVSQSGQLADAGLQNGDLVISINGTDLREDPDEDLAMRLIRRPDCGLEIEYQRLGNVSSEKWDDLNVSCTETIKPDGTKCIRREAHNPDGSIHVKVEEVGHVNPVDADVSGTSVWEGMFIQNSSHDESAYTYVPHNMSGSITSTEQLKPVTINIKKAAGQNDDIGLSLAVSKGLLHVTRVSKNSKVIGKPILPGDTIIGINGRSFQRNPSSKRALQMIKMSTGTVTLTYLRTSSRSNNKRFSIEELQKGPINRLICRNEDFRRQHYDTRHNA